MTRPDTAQRTYTPSTISREVTPDHKRAVWAAIGAGRLHTFADVSRATGIPGYICAEVLAEGTAAGRIRLHDEGPGLRWLVQVPQ